MDPRFASSTPMPTPNAVPASNPFLQIIRNSGQVADPNAGAAPPASAAYGGQPVADIPTPPERPSTAQAIANQPMPQITGYGGGTAAVFDIANSVLHGYMAGKAIKEQREQQKAVQQVQGVNTLWSQARDQYQQAAAQAVAQGQDPATSNDPAMVNARNAANTAWQLRTQAMAAYAMGPEDGKKGKGKKQAAIDPKDPQSLMQNLPQLILAQYSKMTGVQAAGQGANPQAQGAQLMQQQQQLQSERDMDEQRSLIQHYGADRSTWPSLASQRYDALTAETQGPKTPEQQVQERVANVQLDVLMGKKVSPDIMRAAGLNPQPNSRETQVLGNKVYSLVYDQDGKITGKTELGDAPGGTKRVLENVQTVNGVQHKIANFVDAQNNVTGQMDLGETAQASREGVPRIVHEDGKDWFAFIDANRQVHRVEIGSANKPVSDRELDDYIAAHGGDPSDARTRDEARRDFAQAMASARAAGTTGDAPNALPPAPKAPFGTPAPPPGSTQDPLNIFGGTPVGGH